MPSWEREQSNNGALLNTPVRRHRRRRILQNVDVANAVDAARQANYDAGAASAFSMRPSRPTTKVSGTP